MSAEKKQDIVREDLQNVEPKVDDLNGIETEKADNESNPEVDYEIIKRTLEAREEELEKWQKELAEKASQLEAESIRIRQKNAELDEREKLIEECKLEEKILYPDDLEQAKKIFCFNSVRKLVEVELCS